MSSPRQEQENSVEGMCISHFLSRQYNYLAGLLRGEVVLFLITSPDKAVNHTTHNNTVEHYITGDIWTRRSLPLLHGNRQYKHQRDH